MTRLARAKVHRNIELPQQWAGLEIADLLLLGLIGALLVFFNARGLGWNALAVVVTYIGLRIAKRGKPEGWLTAVARFYGRRPFYSAAVPDVVGRAHPFPIVDLRSLPPGPRTSTTTAHKE